MFHSWRRERQKVEGEKVSLETKNEELDFFNDFLQLFSESDIL